MNSPQFLESADGVRAEIVRCESWPEARKLLGSVDLIVIDCRDVLLYKIAAHFLCFPWTRKRLVAVDLVLRKPLGVRYRAAALIKRLLLARVDHFIHYFRDISGYTKYFGVSQARSSFVPFKVNHRDIRPAEVREDYIFTIGVSLRDYDTFIRAVAELPFPAAMPQFSFDKFEGRDRSFVWNRQNVPSNLTILPDSGSRQELVNALARARLVVVPTQASSLCASGLSTYLDAMYLGKCVIATSAPGTADVLTDQALLVPPHDVAALKDTIRLAWDDDCLRHRTAESGRKYASSLGGEGELLERIFSDALGTWSSAGKRSN